MFLLIAFAFIAGFVTILSPCILPILPVVLSGSLTGDKWRPYGVVAGFVGSFTFFTLFLSIIVRATGISADSLRLLSVLVIALFGISLIVPKCQEIVEKLFSKLAGAIPSQGQRHGFWGGVAIGVSVGLIWTPCVGPILASVISLALSGSVSGTAIAITLAYSLGTAIPMFAIIQGGRTLLTRVPYLLQNTKNIQRVFGVLMLLTALGIFFNVDRKFQTFILEKFPQYGVGLTQFEDNAVVKTQIEQLRTTPMPEEKRGKPMSDFIENDLGSAPEFIPGGQWFNPPAGGQPLTLKSLRGKVVLVDFWTYTCINCIRTLPYLRSWHEKYKDKGLVIVGVHTPEFEFEKNADNVAKAIADFKLEYPIMQDNNYATWNAYANRYWPAKYFVDKNGKIRWTHFGEGAYDESEKWIQKLLEETGTTVEETIDNPDYDIYSRTPELYLGNWRIAHFSSPEKIQERQVVSYTKPAQLASNTFAFTGNWMVGNQHANPSGDSVLDLNFESREVFLVMRPKNGPGKLRVHLDGKLVDASNKGEDVIDGVVTVDVDRLYKLIKLSQPARHILTLEFLDDNLELYAFTFG